MDWEGGGGRTTSILGSKQMLTNRSKRSSSSSKLFDENYGFCASTPVDGNCALSKF